MPAPTSFRFKPTPLGSALGGPVLLLVSLLVVVPFSGSEGVPLQEWALRFAVAGPTFAFGVLLLGWRGWSGEVEVCDEGLVFKRGR